MVPQDSQDGCQSPQPGADTSQTLTVRMGWWVATQPGKYLASLPRSRWAQQSSATERPLGRPALCLVSRDHPFAGKQLNPCSAPTLHVVRPELNTAQADIAPPAQRSPRNKQSCSKYWAWKVEGRPTKPPAAAPHARREHGFSCSSVDLRTKGDLTSWGSSSHATQAAQVPALCSQP